MQYCRKKVVELEGGSQGEKKRITVCGLTDLVLTV